MNIKKLALAAGLGIAAVAAASAVPTAASAAVKGWTTRGVTQHAGPGNQYPRVGYIPGGREVRIFGCVRGFSQCDVGFRGNRGWVSGRSLSGFYKNKRVPLVSFGGQIGLPFITFNFGYWDNHYKGKPFFKERGKWDKNWRGPQMGDRDIKGPRMGDGKPRGGEKECRPGERGDDCRPVRPL